MIRGRLAVVAGLLSASAVLSGAILIGLQVPQAGRLPPFPRTSQLDYALPRSGIAPLRSQFIEQVLGIAIPDIPPSADGYRVGVERSIASEALGGAPVVVSHRFTNDSFRDAYAVSSVPFSAHTNTSRATREQGEPAGCAPVNGGTAWYRYRPARSVGLITNTFGSDYATSLAVFAGTKMSDLRRVGCSADPQGFAQLAFPAHADTTYWFQVGAYVNGGNLVFNLLFQGVTTMASVSTRGVQSDSSSVNPTMSGDGAWVSFYSAARTLTPNHPPPQPCIENPTFALCRPRVYLRDRRSHATSRSDVPPGGDPAVDPGVPGAFSITGGVSDDGRYVCFWSTDPGLVANDTNGTWDTFVLDRRTGKIAIASVSSTGVHGNGASYGAEMSADGRYVAFASAATNLVPGDTNAVPDIFVHDMKTGTTTRVSVSSAGGQGNATPDQSFPAATGSYFPSMSANGRYIEFDSASSNLVSGDTNGFVDVFVHDMKTRTTKRVNVSSAGAQANGDTRGATAVSQWLVSDDGRYAFFNSDATNLVPNDTNGAEDIFVHDMKTGRTDRVDVSSTGAQGDRGAGGTQDPTGQAQGALNQLFVARWNTSPVNFSASPDARYVVFSSDSTTLVPGDTNETTDCFLRDRLTGTTTLVSVSSTGEEGDGASNACVVSADGLVVAFDSHATNLVPGDTNQNTDIFVHELPGFGPPSRRF